MISYCRPSPSAQSQGTCCDDRLSALPGTWARLLPALLHAYRLLAFPSCIPWVPYQFPAGGSEPRLWQLIKWRLPHSKPTPAGVAPGGGSAPTGAGSSPVGCLLRGWHMPPHFLPLPFSLRTCTHVASVPSQPLCSRLHRASLPGTCTDPAVIVSFPVDGDADGACLVAWTTTPWTLPSNLALCVHAEFDYVKARDPGERSSGATRRLVCVLRAAAMQSVRPWHGCLTCGNASTWQGAWRAGEQASRDPWCTAPPRSPHAGPPPPPPPPPPATATGKVYIVLESRLAEIPGAVPKQKKGKKGGEDKDAPKGFEVRALTASASPGAVSTQPRPPRTLLRPFLRAAARPRSAPGDGAAATTRAWRIASPA